MTDTSKSRGPLPPVTIQPSRDGFQLTCPDLGITCTAPTIEAGYAALNDLANGLTEESSSPARAFSAGSGVERFPLATPPQQAGRFSMLFRFAITAALLPVVLMLLSILNETRMVVSELRQFTASTGDLLDDTKRLARLGGLGLDRVADTVDQLTPERQEELRNNLERISLKLAPVAEGLRPLLAAISAAESRPGDEASTPGAPIIKNKPRETR